MPNTAIKQKTSKKPRQVSTTGETQRKEGVVTPTHPWRLCPSGEHWVRTHDLHVPPSKKNPADITVRQGHCAKNPSRKDSMYLDEIHEITSKYFSKLKGPPNVRPLSHEDENKFDSAIRGWTKYWNEVFLPNNPLDPDVIKALIASESMFEAAPTPGRAGKAGKAHGLIQVTDQARKVLRNPKGELQDHLIYLDEKDLYDPNASICAGVRWLFHKKKLASIRLKREATWEEAIAEYKGYLDKMISGKNPNPRGMDRFNKELQKLKEE